MSVTSPPSNPQQETTQLALAEKSHLQKSLRRLDMVGFTLCAFVGLDTLGTVASHGVQGFTWLSILAFLFVIPYGLLMCEVGSAFTQEGGPYEWVKLAFGRFQGGIAAVLYWITNPLWIGGSLAFFATAAWDGSISSLPSGGFWDYVFKLSFIWLSITVAIVSLKRGKWIPNLGALLRVILLTLFTITTIIYAIQNGVEGFAASELKPTWAIFLALVPLLIFNYVGFELQSGAAEEMEDPQQDVPRAVLRSGALGVTLYAVPILAILLVLPAEKVTGIAGFLDAVTTTFSVYGGAQGVLVDIMAICFIGTLLTSGAVWMMGGDRILAVAAADGAFPGWFGRFHPTLGTPVRVNVISGVFSTVFMVFAVAAFNGGTNAKFLVVLTIAISTTLISYLWIFPAAVKLRFSHPRVHRPYRVPGGRGGIVTAGILTTFWVALGSWVAVFPGTLEPLVGLEYNFLDTWGVTRGEFTTLTLATLAVVFLVAVIGYRLGAPVRRSQVVVPLDAEK